MKTIIKLSFVLIFVSVFAEAKLKFNPNHFLNLHIQKSKFFRVLRELRDFGDNELSTIFPPVITLRKHIDSCYDQTVDNRTANIFKHKFKQIVKIYFVSNLDKNHLSNTCY